MTNTHLNWNLDVEEQQEGKLVERWCLKKCPECKEDNREHCEFFVLTRLDRERVKCGEGGEDLEDRGGCSNNNNDINNSNTTKM